MCVQACVCTGMCHASCNCEAKRILDNIEGMNTYVVCGPSSEGEL